MVIDPLVLLFQPAGAGLRKVGAMRTERLRRLGFDVQPCSAAPQLYQLARHYPPQARQPLLTILDGPFADNCSAASRLRTLRPQAGILALMDPSHENQAIQALRSGIDMYCSKQSSVPLLEAALLGLLRRSGGYTEAAGPVSYGAGNQGVWSLQERAWVLISPAGKRVPLTTGERAFMVGLLNAPQSRAKRADLIAAVDAGYASSSPAACSGRLGVLVSRMRNKFEQHGEPLPLKSVHGWGYMFTGALDAISPTDS